jgi:hexosaminidase
VTAALTDRLDGLLPQPLEVVPLGGDVVLTGEIACPTAVRDAGALLGEYLHGDGGTVRLSEPGAAEPGSVILTLDPTDVPAHEEGYVLLVDDGMVRLRARASAGLRAGIQTLRQLAGRPGPGERWRLPATRIRDTPRLAWRGTLLDVGRWFMPLPDLRRYVDVLAAHKLTTLHLHLTEDQGWRFESARYPRLTEIGAWRRESPLGHQSDGRADGIPHGGYYTQDQLRDLVAFAARRGVEIMPEIDLPGHTTAAIAAYPELGNTDVTGPVEVATTWGIHPTVLNPQESTMRFVEDVLDEVLDVFPGQRIHLGGDECPTTEWVASPAARERAAELGLPGPHRLQSWFSARMCAFVRARGRVPVVWDEAADDPELEPDAVVMAWREARYGIAAARRGHRVVMTPQDAVYLDFSACTEPDRPVSREGGITTLRDAYAFDAVPADQPAGVRAQILGTQAQIWTEYLPTPAAVDALAFPRLCAIADRAWSHAADYDGFLRRLAAHVPRLSAMGVTVPDERMWGA